MIDAAGAIYVIGGYDGTTGTYYKDVWASTDGGARAGVVTRGYVMRTTGVLRGI